VSHKANYFLETQNNPLWLGRNSATQQKPDSINEAKSIKILTRQFISTNNILAAQTD